MLRYLIWLLPLAFLSGQTASPQFEVASVRPAAPFAAGEQPNTHGGPGTSDPEKITYRGVALRDLILQVYGIKSLQLSIPGNFYYKLRYDIIARIPPGTNKERFNTMMRNLLADRFGMKFRYQTKKFDTYKLVIAKGGPRLTETMFKSDALLSPEDPSRRVARKDPDGTIYAPGHVLTKPGNGRLLMSAGKMSMQFLANQLEMRLSGPVTDATGLAGEYDIRLEFSPEGLTLPGATSAAVSKGQSPDAASEPAPNIFEALQQQLGLRLEKSTAMLDVMIVDHLDEVPTEN